MSNEMMTTKGVVAELSISEDSALRLMKTTKGVAVLPTLAGKGKRITRRMPRAIFEVLLARSSEKNCF